jgi:hypothetical protein
VSAYAGKADSPEASAVTAARLAAPANDENDIALLNPKIDRGLFAPIALDLVLDGLSLVE